MSSLVSDVVRYRARSVVSRYLHQRGEPTVMLPSSHSLGVQPSNLADTTTTRLKEALALVDVRVLDHIIVGTDGCY